MDTGTTVTIGVLCTLLGSLLGLLTFVFARKKQIKDEAKADESKNEEVSNKLTSISTDLAWTRSTLIEIKTAVAAQSKDQEQIKIDLGKVDVRLTAVEQEIKQIKENYNA